MSRIGRAPVEVPKEVKVGIGDGKVMVEGPRGKLELSLPRGVKARQDAGRVVVEVDSSVRLSAQELGARHGLARALIRNMVEGVTKGYERKIELVGAGYRPTVKGNMLSLLLGFSHPVEVNLPEGVKATAERVEGAARGDERHVVSLTGCDKALVGELAAKIRRIKPADIYKGKGIRYFGEVLRHKAGKAAVATAGGGTGGK